MSESEIEAGRTGDGGRTGERGGTGDGVPHGGHLVAGVLARYGVRHLFTLCGGHISPILAGAKARGIRVVDVRDEASAVFAADAVARLTGVPGVAAVTAGPGVTNAVTAIKNAQLAQSPVVVFGGATATVLKGRGSLQDIDQESLLESAVKRVFTASTVRELPEMVEEALCLAAGGVPGPVFVEVPVDLLYDEALVRGWYLGKRGGGIGGWLLRRYLGWHLNRLFKGVAAVAEEAATGGPGRLPEPAAAPDKALRKAAKRLAAAKRPVLVVGSQAMVGTGGSGATVGSDGEADRGAGRSPVTANRVAAAVEALGVPTWLAGGARGLLGPASDLRRRHQRTRALKGADLVILAGVPADFRLDYGRSIGRRTRIVAANLSDDEMTRNRKPDLAVEASLSGRPSLTPTRPYHCRFW